MTETTQQDIATRRFVSLEQASEFSTLSIPTLRRAIRSKRLRAFRPSGRRVLIVLEDLTEWIRGRGSHQREPEGGTD